MANRTKQREVILNVFKEASGPISASKAHEIARQVLPELNLATIYRTIKFLKNERKLTSFSGPGGLSRFETTQRGHHHHFYCRVCRSLTDFYQDPITIEDLKTTLPGNLKAEAYEIFVTGICADCQEKSNGYLRS